MFDAAEVLAGRASLLGLVRRGRISAGGATRLIAGQDGWFALTLSRSDDIDTVPAMLESDPPIRSTAHTLWTGLHGLVSIQHSLAMDGSIQNLEAMADGLVDVLVSPQRRDGPAYPPQTEVDRYIAETVVDKP